METMGGFLGTAGNYYLSDENIKNQERFGTEAQTGLSALAGRAREDIAFKPYTVTSNIGNVAGTAEGGFNINLSPEQQALQAQLQGQAGGLFGQVGQDPAAQQAAIYEQIRATQRPEEERNRLAMQENLFASGRGGISTAQYGGSPEQFALAKAQAEAQNTASLGARNQVIAEQEQALRGATGLLNASYQPGREALDMFGAATPAAGYADAARRGGVAIGSELELGGMEANLGARDLANRLALQRDKSLIDSMFGQQPTELEKAQIAKLYAEAGLSPTTGSGGGGMFGSLYDMFTNKSAEEAAAAAGAGSFTIPPNWNPMYPNQ
jgi:hypothetical protein